MAGRPLQTSNLNSSFQMGFRSCWTTLVLRGSMSATVTLAYGDDTPTISLFRKSRPSTILTTNEPW